MKYVIVLLFPFLCIAQVNLSTYGVIGDGIADDTTAFQNAVDNESNLIANPNLSVRIGATINFDQSIAHTIDMNGSTFSPIGGQLGIMFLVDKRTSNGGATTINNFTIDGNASLTRAFEVATEINMDNFTITDLLGTVPSPSAFKFDIYDHPSVGTSWNITNGFMTYVYGTDDGTITNALGAANIVLGYWQQVPSNDLIITFDNVDLNNCWSEDSGLLYILNNVGSAMENSGTRFIMRDCELRDVERRTLKGFGGNIEAYNCIFQDPDPNNPEIGPQKTNSGLVTLGGYNNILEGCRFIKVGDYDGRVIPVNAYRLEINNCIFENGADIPMTQDLGDIYICGNEFQGGGTVYDYSPVTDLGEVFIGTNNINLVNNLDQVSFLVTNLSCPPIPPIIQNLTRIKRLRRLNTVWN